MNPAPMRIAAAALAACLATPALADLTVYDRTGSWDAFRGTAPDGRQVCGIGNTNPADGRAFSVRVIAGDEPVTFVASKPNWNIPEGTRIPVVMQIGLARPWTEQATGHADRVEWTMDRVSVQAFDAEFRRASSMTITFPAGSEQPWVVSLNGSTAASNTMGRCVTQMMQQPVQMPAGPAAPSQPTQPFGAAPGSAPSPEAPPAGAPAPGAPPAGAR